MVLGGEAEGGEVVVEEIVVEFLLFDDAGDIAKMALMFGFLVEAELVYDDVFGGGDVDFAGRGGDAAGVFERPWKGGMVT